MIRDEIYADGVVVAANCYDLDTSTYTREEYGVPVATRPMSPGEIAAFTPAPDPRATLLAEVQAATTVAKLRAAVLAAIEQGAL